MPVPVDGGQVCKAIGRPLANVDASRSSPPPYPFELPLIGWAVLVSSALTWSGVAAGYFCRINAAAPETIAVDWEVPLPRK